MISEGETMRCCPMCSTSAYKITVKEGDNCRICGNVPVFREDETLMNIPSSEFLPFNVDTTFPVFSNDGIY